MRNVLLVFTGVAFLHHGAMLSGQEITTNGAPAPGLTPQWEVWEPPPDTIYIDPSNQNDAAENGTLEHPFDAITDVRWGNGRIGALRRGTVLRTNAFGIRGDEITLCSYGQGPRPIVRCTSVAERGKNQHAIRVDSAHRLTLRDIQIEAPDATSCLRLGGGCSDVKIINCRLQGAVWGIRAFGFSGLKIVTTEVHDIKDDGMFIQGVNDIEIAHCYVHDVNQNWKPPHTSQKEAGGDAVQFHLCDRWHVHHNVLDRSNSGNKFCFISNNPSQKNGIFEHNLTRGPLPTKEGGSALYFHDGDGLVIRYNTILGPAPSALYSHATNLQIYGNIVANTSGGIHASKSARVLHNSFYRIAGPLVSGGDISFVNNAAETGSGATSPFGKVRRLQQSHNLLLDRANADSKGLFADPANLDLRPADRAPCIDAGCPTEIQSDRAGVRIPQGKAPDIGAFETMQN